MRHIVGVALLLISCIFYCCPYICSAIYLKNSNNYSEEMFNLGIEYIGGHFTLLSILFFIVGVAYLIWAEKKEK